MAKFRFAFLLDMARDDREEAARAMQAAQVALLSGKQKLEQVENFRAEYRGRLMSSGQGGITVVQWRDFQHFLAKLDTAANAQRGEVARLEQAYEQCRDAWHECEKKVKAYEALETRHQAAELAREAKQEQKLNDEFNSRPRQR
ncbi:flagellar export protein FliJ [Chitiniphilus eburneus]|uniref:Flagellar FliJ protein n=1 Tax=Chitiniphilus eburneus TaxID=2571148 RepID=A0A4V5MNR8_9NEIS|nr:flagellar export protein FliJ [Chitiniphilus eburneus]TJZ65888.1 flagellar export protein FliJ [Chitiniphilus eburneus]